MNPVPSGTELETPADDDPANDATVNSAMRNGSINNLLRYTNYKTNSQESLVV